MSLVTEYVEERQSEVESERHNREGMRRVTVRLPGDSIVMLAEVSAALDKTNTGCAEELLKAAIQEAWLALGPKTMEDIQRTLQGLVSDSSAKGKQGKSRIKDKPE